MPAYKCPKGHSVVELMAYKKPPKTFYCPFCGRTYPVDPKNKLGEL